MPPFSLVGQATGKGLSVNWDASRGLIQQGGGFGFLLLVLLLICEANEDRKESVCFVTLLLRVDSMKAI